MMVQKEFQNSGYFHRANVKKVYKFLKFTGVSLIILG